MIDISDVFLGQLERVKRFLCIKTLVKIVYCTGIYSNFILFDNKISNITISKINRILNRCSDNVIYYIYNFFFIYL